MHDIYLVLDDIRSALNVGAIFRTCDCTAIKKLFLTGITPYPPHNRIPKTALGATESVAWEYNKDKIKVIEELKEKGIKIVSLEITPDAKDIFTYNFELPTAIVAGNEIWGVDKSILELSDAVVYIPMYGAKESLNVATTCGIALYETIRQTRGQSNSN